MSVMLTHFSCIALMAVNDKDRLLKEVLLMLNFNHPNVMSLIGLSFEGEMPLLIMPFMSKGNVLGYVREHRETLFLTDIDHEKVETIGTNYIKFSVTIILSRYKKPQRQVWECATRYPKGWLTLQSSSLFTVTWPQGTACNFTPLTFIYTSLRFCL